MMESASGGTESGLSVLLLKSSAYQVELFNVQWRIQNKQWVKPIEE